MAGLLTVSLLSSEMIVQSLSLKLILIFVVIFYSEQMSGDMKISRDESNDCSCVGDTLTFECTVMSGLGTIWRGSAFNCDSNGNEIFLLNHSNEETCNSGMITGRVIRRDNDSYTSQLNVILSYDLIGRVIECARNNGAENLIGIFNTTLDICPFSPPDEISLALVNFGRKEIVFSWSPVAPNCPSIHYNILASSNCGSCPTTTNHTNATCTDLSNDDSMCSFAVQTVVCGNKTGTWSKPLTFNITETLMTSSKTAADTISISIITVGVSALLVTIVIVILACHWLRKRNATLKTGSRRNEPAIANSNFESSLSLQSQTNAQQEEDFQASQDTTVSCLQNKDTGYSQLEETPVNLKRLLEKLQGRISKQWYQLGLTLGLPMDVLEGFNLYSEDDCLVEVLDYWLKHHSGKPTWQEITDAQKKVEMFNTEQDAGAGEKKVAITSEVPPKKPPRRTSSVTMKKPMNTETTVDDVDHEYEVIH